MGNEKEFQKLSKYWRNTKENYWAEKRKKKLKRKIERQKLIQESIQDWRNRKNDEGFVERVLPPPPKPKIEIRRNGRTISEPVEELKSALEPKLNKVAERMRAAGYVINAKGEPEHRAVYREHHGPIPKFWEVHHINEIRNDNRIENLVALPIYFHRKIHREGNPACYTKEYLQQRLKVEGHLYEKLMSRRKELQEKIEEMFQELKKISRILKDRDPE